MRRRQDARTGLFMDHHAGVLADLPGELVGAAVHCIDPRGAALEQDVGKPAGRRTHVDRHGARDIPTGRIEPVRQLDPAARHPGMIAPAHVEQDVVRHRLTRLVDLAVAH